MERYFIFLLLIFSSCTNRDEKSMDSSAHVEPAKEMSYEIRDDSGKVWKILEKLVVKYDFSKRVHKYDELGNEMEEALYDKSGHLAYKIVNSYDSLGRTTEKRFYNSEDSLEYISTLKYHDSGQKAEMVLSNCNISAPVCVIRYDEMGEPIRTKMRLYYSDGNPVDVIFNNRFSEPNIIVDSISEYERKYAKNPDLWFSLNRKKKKESLVFLRSRQLFGVVYRKSKYDSNNNVIEESDYFSNGKMWSKSIHEYDKKGRKLESSHYSSHGILEAKEIFDYSIEGYKVERIGYLEYGQLFNFTTRIYDNNENLIEAAFSLFDYQGRLKLKSTKKKSIKKMIYESENSMPVRPRPGTEVN